MTDKLRKYVLPNTPYVFIGWAFLKLGTAYRLAAGSDFAHKFIGLGQTIGAAFADFAPGLALFDWLVGIVGAVAFRLLIYFKSKNAKKFRRDAEYGSARWGNEKDIKPFVDPKFENNMLLTATERLTMNTRPKNPANARNLNFCGIGSSGSGKTRFWLTPQLLQAHSSYVVVDPKGGVLGQVGSFLQKRGYKIKVFNSIDFSKSMHYNPLAYIKTEADILKFVNALISNTKGEGKEGDPFWTKAETLLYCALLGYIIFEGAEEDRNMNTLVDMISGMEVKEDDEDFLNAVDYMFKGLEQRKPNCFAVKQYKKYKLSSGVGFLYIRTGTTLPPYADGGAQEHGLRAGTENVAGIVSMAVALKKNVNDLDKNQRHILKLEGLLLQALNKSGIPYVRNGGDHTLPGVISLSFDGKDGEAILHRMDLMGVCISTGSACDSKNTEISHVLQAIRMPESLAKGTIRISLGKNNTADDIDTIVTALRKILL